VNYLLLFLDEDLLQQIALSYKHRLSMWTDEFKQYWIT